MVKQPYRINQIVGWVRRRVNFDENIISFYLSRNPPLSICSILYFLYYTVRRTDIIIGDRLQ